MPITQYYRDGICIYNSSVALRNCGGRQIPQNMHFYIVLLLTNEYLLKPNPKMVCNILYSLCTSFKMFKRSQNFDKMNILYANLNRLRKRCLCPTESSLQNRTSLSAHMHQFYARLEEELFFFFLLNTPCTYPRRSYLESLHSDAHRVPYLCPGRGHEEFRALWSS